MKFLIDSLSHGFQLFAVIFLQGYELSLHRFPHPIQLLIVGLGQLPQLFCERIQLCELVSGIFIDSSHDGFIVLMNQPGKLFPKRRSAA